MINLVRMFTIDEGCRNNVYEDTEGNKSVGIGFNMDDPHARGVWIHADIPESFTAVYNGTQLLSKDSIWKLLNVCIENATKDCKSVFPQFEYYPDFVQFALINLMFNMGLIVFLQFNTFIRLIKERNYNAASDDLSHTKWAKQVKKRADRVMALLKGDDSEYD